MTKNAANSTLLEVTEYRVESAKVQGEIRLAVVADFHSCDYGENQRELTAAIAAAHPDILLYPGDIIDDTLPPDHAASLFAALQGRWPAYYVLGNHELRHGRGPDCRALAERHGVRVLAGNGYTQEVRGSRINLCGVEDATAGEAAFRHQLAHAREGLDPNLYTVLLAHRPERIADYRGRGYDLILSGHAHGGQWRLPGLPQGLFAPQQGLFPRHTAGLHPHPNGSQIISRGLARESTRFVPRLWNRPELVVVSIGPLRG